MDDDHSRLFSKIRNGRVTIPDHVSVHAKFLIRCLLHKDPSKRPTCGEILNHIWLRQHQNASTMRPSMSNSSSSRTTSRPINSSQTSTSSSIQTTVASSTTSTVATSTTTDQSSPASPNPVRVGSPSEASIGNSDAKEAPVEKMEFDDQVVPNIDMPRC